MTAPNPYSPTDPHLTHALAITRQEYGRCVHCKQFHLRTTMTEVEWEQPGVWRLVCVACAEWRDALKERWRCGECQQLRPDDARVAAGMKCGPCAYGGEPKEEPNEPTA